MTQIGKCTGRSRISVTFSGRLTGVNMVILDGRCLCVGSCCCLDLPVPKLNSKESYKAPPCLQAIKASSQRSLASEETRADDRLIGDWV
eukprot:s3671_g1.t1